MDIPITFTFSQLIQGFLALCGGIATIGVAAGWVIKVINHMKAPQTEQNERLDALEQEVNLLKGYSQTDKEKLEELTESDRLTKRALLALLSHGIDGNNVEEMEHAKTELTNFLISK